MNRVDHLKQALPYIRRHRGATIVVKLGGRVLENREALLALAEDLSLLQSVGVKLVVVHGGGPQMGAMAARMDLPQTVIEGRRVTDDDTLDLAKMLFRGKLNLDLVAALREFGTLAVGLSGSDAGLIEAVRRPAQTTPTGDTVDYGHVGDIVRVDPSLLHTLCGAGYVPVVCSLASTASGGILNVNADTIAQQISVALGAAKLFLMTDTPGLLRDPSDPRSLVGYCDLAEVDQMIESGQIKGGMKPKLSAAKAALTGGVEKVHLASAFEPSALLLELFTDEGCGTLVVRDRGEVQL